MGCINVKIDRIGGLLLGVSRKDRPLNVEIEDVFKNQHLNVTCGIVCSVAELAHNRSILVASDEIFVLVDGSMFTVIN